MTINKIFNNVYENKKVLITGHTGFKGSWLTLWLTEMGADVTGYSLDPPTKPGLFSCLELDKKIEHIIGDIRDAEKIKKILKKYKPEMVFHLAAQSLVRASYKEPKLTYETNVMGTVNLFEAVRNTESVRVVVNVTSDKCYENKEWIYGYKETDTLGGYDPYSSSKACAELVTSCYRNSFFYPPNYNKTHNVALASVRAGNVIGGGDWAQDRLIPDCIKALNDGQTIYIRNPLAIRAWQYVLEPLSGYLWLGNLLFEKGNIYSEGWNFGPSDNDILTVDDVVKKVLKLWENGRYEITHDTKMHETELLKLDISKARFILDWNPIYTVNTAIEETINWYKEFYYGDKKKIFEFTLNQIEKYIKAAKEAVVKWSIE